MLREYKIEEQIVKFDKMAKTWPVAIGVEGDTYKYVVRAETTCRSPFGVINKFLEEGRLDALLVYAVMHAETEYKNGMNMFGDEELDPEDIPPKRKYKRREKKEEQE
jgi:hypothetical protein